MAVPLRQVSMVPKRKPVNPCKWKEDTFTILEILKNETLPMVAMVKKTTTDMAPNLNCVSSQPLLFCSLTVKTKVEALQILSNSKSAKVANEHVVIPEDYAGKKSKCENYNLTSMFQL